jgi:hypothetical protein
VGQQTRVRQFADAHRDVVEPKVDCHLPVACAESGQAGAIKCSPIGIDAAIRKVPFGSVRTDFAETTTSRDPSRSPFCFKIVSSDAGPHSRLCRPPGSLKRSFPPRATRERFADKHRDLEHAVSEAVEAVGVTSLLERLDLGLQIGQCAMYLAITQP